MTTSPIPEHLQIAFIGGGNMASAILGGLVRQGMAPDRIRVVEPFAETRARLQQEFGVQVLEAADASLAEADVVVWAVKPQQFEEATRPVAGHVRQALHLSVAAGIPASALTRWLGTERLVRAMPNTPALVGQGMTGLFAGAGASAQDRAVIDALLAPTGQRMWLEQEALIDSLMAISGSGPAYVFYFIEALVRGGVELGLTAEQSKTLAAQTFAGAAALVTELRRLGAEAEETADGLRIVGGGDLRPAVLHTYADHRMVHFAALLALRVPGIAVTDLDCVSKTMPHFARDWHGLVGR